MHVWIVATILERLRFPKKFPLVLDFGGARFLSPRRGTKGKKAKLASGNVGEIRFKWAIVGKIEKGE